MEVWAKLLMREVQVLCEHRFPESGVWDSRIGSRRPIGVDRLQDSGVTQGNFFAPVVFTRLKFLFFNPRFEGFMVLRVRYFVITVALFLSLTCFFERPAYGYVDPGSSLLMFQSVSAFVTGVLFYFRRRLKGLFIRPRVESGEPRNSR